MEESIAEEFGNSPAVTMQIALRSYVRIPINRVGASGSVDHPSACHRSLNLLQHISTWSIVTSTFYIHFSFISRREQMRYKFKEMSDNTHIFLKRSKKEIIENIESAISEKDYRKSRGGRLR